MTSINQTKSNSLWLHKLSIYTYIVSLQFLLILKLFESSRMFQSIGQFCKVSTRQRSKINLTYGKTKPQNTLEMRIFRKYIVSIPTQYVVKNLPYSLDLIALTDSVLCAPEVTVKFFRRFPPRRQSLDKFDAILTIPRIFFDVTKLSLHIMQCLSARSKSRMLQ